MKAFIDAISYNSWAYMFFLGGIIVAIYVILFIFTKVYINRHKQDDA